MGARLHSRRVWFEEQFTHAALGRRLTASFTRCAATRSRHREEVGLTD